MPLTNYGELKESVASWLDRTDLNSQIPDFIALAEKEIFRELRCPTNEKRTTFSSNDFPNSEGITLPGDYEAARTVQYDGKPMDRKTDQWYLDQMYRAPGAGEPHSFARIVNTLKFYPPPDNNSDVILTYWSAQGPLVSDTDTTPTLLYAPGLYLFGALKQAAAYLIGDERVPLWEMKYQTILNDIALQAEEGETSGSTSAVSSVYADEMYG